jgi:hypothetical protein
MWAITAYFDPFGTKSRLAAFREFRRRLRLPLVAVELCYGDASDLERDDADVLIRLSGEAILWQKERLLNIALQALPSRCDTVAWLDGDIVFAREDWAAEAQRVLDRCALLQPFSRLRYLRRHATPEDYTESVVEETFDSAARRWAEGSLPDESFRVAGSSGRFKYAPGMAWVTRRELLERCGGLYDAAVLGYADKLMLAAACGRQADAAQATRMNPGERRHYEPWARQFHQAVGGRISYVEGDLLHLWHGDLAHRGYSDRYLGVDRFEFEPTADIGQTEEGVWRWSSDKPGLHSHVRRVFERIEQICSHKA